MAQNHNASQATLHILKNIGILIEEMPQARNIISGCLPCWPLPVNNAVVQGGNILPLL